MYREINAQFPDFLGECKADVKVSLLTAALLTKKRPSIFSTQQMQEIPFSGRHTMGAKISWADTLISEQWTYTIHQTKSKPRRYISRTKR